MPCFSEHKQEKGAQYSCMRSPDPEGQARLLTVTPHDTIRQNKSPRALDKVSRSFNLNPHQPWNLRNVLSFPI